MKRIWFALGMSLFSSGALANDSWQMALAQMPLSTQTQRLERTNCVDIMLGSFRSNRVVKALIFMPGATDEFYMFRRAKARLITPSPSLLDAVIALTNQTVIRATFKAPLLLLHTDEDILEPAPMIRDQATAEKLKRAAFISHVQCNDRDWDTIQPMLRWALKVDVRPWKRSTDSWHFYRHSFAAWSLTGWEALETAALAGRSQFTKLKLRFDPEIRSPLL